MIAKQKIGPAVQTEALYGAAFEASPSALVLVDCHGDIKLVNKATEEMFGAGRAELTGQPVEILLPERYRAGHRHQRARFADGHNNRSLGSGRDLYAIRRDGTEFRAEIGLTLVETVDGAMVLATIIDITGRTSTEDALRSSEERYRTLFDASPLGIVYVNRDGCIVSANQAATALLRKGHLSADDCNLFTLPWVDNKGNPLRADDFPGRKAFLANAPVMSTVAGLRNGDEDTTQWFLISATPAMIRPGGGGDEVFLTLTDITDYKRIDEALKESETNFRQVADTAPAMLWMDGPGMRSTYYNARWLEFTGRTLEQELADPYAEGVIHPEDHAMFLDVYSRAAEAREPFTLEYRLRRHDGVYRWVLDKAMPRLDSNGNVVGYVGSCVDITEQREAVDISHSHAHFMRQMVENESAAVFVIDQRHKVIAWNRACEELTGVKREDIIDQPSWLGFYKRERPVLADLVLDHRTDEAAAYYPVEGPSTLVSTAWHGEDWFENMNGLRRYVIFDAAPIRDAAGEIVAVVETLQDVTSLTQAREQNELAATAFENLAEAVVITDANNRIVSVNRAFVDITGYRAEEVLGQDPKILRSGRHDKAFYESMWRSLHERSNWRGEIWNCRKNGEVFVEWLNINTIRDKAGRITHFVSVFADISELKQAQARIEHLAYNDALTGLPNRSLLTDRMRQALSQARRKKSHVAVLFMDLDRFKTINDSLGHAVGDKLLCEVATALQGAVRDVDTVARLGGDEFVIVLADLDDIDGAVRVAKSIIEVVSQPVDIDHHLLRVTPSIGISLFPQDGDDVTTLLKNADNAMYHAKSAGRGTFQFFSAQMDRLAHERFRIESDLRGALERGEFELYFQKQLDVDTGAVTGAEALLRWQHPARGLLSPATFLSVAEDCGLIVPIGAWVIEEACRACAAWHEAGYRLRISVNVSARQILDSNLVTTVGNALRATGLAARHLQLELTETVLVEPNDKTMATFRELAALGARLSVDDFGTGYSALTYLKRFPISQLKIDKGFVDGVATEENDRAIVCAVISLAQALGLETVAEGVETEEQRQVLESLGANALQGYLFSHPVPRDQFLAQLQSLPKKPGFTSNYQI